MALVAYENSDSSEFEDDETESNIQTRIEKDERNDGLVDPTIQNDQQGTEENPSLFTQLPQPSSKKKVVLEEDDEFLHKKALTADLKPKSRITIPSLKDFKDVDVPISSIKTKSSNGKKSSLLNMLPQPRNAISVSRSFIPNVIAKKPNTTTAKKKSTLVSPAKTSVDTKALITDYTDESDNDEVENDFFSINKPVEDFPVEDIALTVEEPVENIKKEPRNIESYFKKDVVLQPELEDYNEEQYENLRSIEVTEYPGESSNNDAVLDEEAILKLCGTRGKRKREDIKLVDVNQQEVLDEARALLMKGLMEDTSKRQSVSKKRGHEPTNQQRRKHQITYLAHQAKANESELQNQWANNRMTKRKTQSKYGF